MYWQCTALALPLRSEVAGSAAVGAAVVAGPAGVALADGADVVRVFRVGDGQAVHAHVRVTVLAAAE